MRTTPTTPDHLLQRLIAISPAFGPYWESNPTFRHDDGTFTFCAVFGLFSWHFRDAFDQFPTASLRALGNLLEDCTAHPHTELDTAAATCFLENLQGESPAPILKAFLTGNALHYFEQLEPPKRRNQVKANKPDQRSPSDEGETS